MASDIPTQTGDYFANFYMIEYIYHHGDGSFGVYQKYYSTKVGTSRNMIRYRKRRMGKLYCNEPAIVAFELREGRWIEFDRIEEYVHKP